MATANTSSEQIARAVVPSPRAAGARLTLAQGRWTSFGYGCAPTESSLHRHEEIEVTVALSPSPFRLSWAQKPGRLAVLQGNGPSLMVIPAGAEHGVQWEGRTEVVTWYVKPRLFQQISGGSGVTALVDPKGFATPSLPIWNLATSVRWLFAEERALESAYVDAVGRQLATHVGWLMEREPTEDGVRTRLPPSRVALITTYIKDRLTDQIQVNDLARLVNLSPAHFTEVFRNAVGVAPHEYILRCRVLRASELLLTREYRVCDVASAVGFCDQSHLNRHFKRIMGYTPKVLVNRIQEQGFVPEIPPNVQNKSEGSR